MKALRTAAWLAAVAATQFGCGKTNNDTTNQPPGSGTAGATDVGGASATTPATGPGGAGGEGSVEVPLDCDSPHPGPSPLSRLSNAALNRAFRAFLPAGDAGTNLPWLAETADPITEPTTPLHNSELTSIHTLAHEIAKLLTDDSSSTGWLAGCDRTAEPAGVCRDLLAEALAEQAYRRPLNREDHDELAEVFAKGDKLGGDFKSGMRAIVEYVLQSPDFLYVIEQGNGEVSGDAVELTSYEQATRLALFLTGAPPDAPLLQAAKNGPLDSDEVTAQTQRLLGSPENRANVSDVAGRLFNLHPMESTDLGFAFFNRELADAALEGSRRFIEDVTFDGAGTLEALLSEPSMWANGPLAAFYGLPGVTGYEWKKVPLDASRAAGLFTQPAFLASHNYSSRTHPVQRGMTILSSVLCSPPPPDPPVSSPSDVPTEAPRGTTRQILEAETGAADCQTCHRDLDATGLAFEHYDTVGRWRDVDSGLPIDSAGELSITDARGPFRDAVELMQHIAKSKDAKACFVTQWLGYAYQRTATPEDACAKAKLTQTFTRNGGNITALLAELVQTDNFRYRLKSELAP